MNADLLYCDTCTPRTMSFIDSPWRQLPSCICSHTLIVVYAIPRWLIVIFAATSWHCRDERMVVVVEFFPMRRRTSTASSISFATITTDVSMVECRVLPIVLLFSLYRAYTGDSSNLSTLEIAYIPENWIYLYQCITIVAYTSCKSDMSAPTVNDHPSIVIILRPDVVCIFINYHHNNYIPALSARKLLFIGYRIDR